MKKKSKHYAKAIGLPGIPQPVMGRPVSGRKLRSFYIGEWHGKVIDEMAALEGVSASKWLEAMIMQSELIKH